MTKSLLQQVMLKGVSKKNNIIDTDALIEKIKSGYIINRGPKFQTKKTFAPSTISYSHGECPRYWYLAFDGILSNLVDLFLHHWSLKRSKST